MRNQVHSPVSHFRLLVVVGIVFAVAAVMMWRAVDLHVMNKDFLQSQGNARYMRTLPVAAHRGIITDRNGEPLAVSTPVDSVWINPAEFMAARDSWGKLTNLLSLDKEKIEQLVLQRSNREFVYLKRHIRPDLAEKIAVLNIDGVYLQREYRRYYPAGEVAAHVLGFTNVDDAGQEGLELAYNDWLRGESGRKMVIKDRLGRTIKHVESIQAAQPGKDLTLSIDRRLQYLAYRELKRAVLQYKAKSASAVILDTKTGEVLAMVNQPSYNPNNRSKLNSNRLRNRAVTDVFEPGSTIKPFTVAAALESGKFKSNSIVNTSPGYFHIGKYVVQDVKNYGRIDLSTIMAKSSNVGASKLALDITAKNLTDVHSRIGFGFTTGSGFPGEVGGILNMPTEKQLVEKATLSYGYGLSVTPLQLARAYAAIANNGVMPAVSFTRISQAEHETKVLSVKHAKQIRMMLEAVVSEKGTGYRADVSGYRIAGKTGTVKKADAGGYSDDRYLAVFAGMAPVSNPRIAMVVTINEPKGDVYYGGKVAAPVFSKVMSGALRLMDIAPDDISDKSVHLAKLVMGEHAQ
ncbi:MAG: penicillin-binding transpeptidase domain-containing protein [Gammaproteobacteria bacterium]|nr:penicillin-binding transpeptidase domain-containing protein [Gammaproteobacteria bacterium]MCW8987218.1 penicillin-binding transpeptidase domain-containing protein [Gammaproteobacteria bacterium]MCW9031075.1 penicillin-binding transpeptidase domain-containing protein [Gammaproteobacteria bacterium]